MKKLFLAWQDPENRRWYTVGQLTEDDGMFRFLYTKGAKRSKNFIPFGRMQNLETEYVSKDLFPLFSNRILSKSRPEYAELVEWLNLDENKDNTFEMLSLTAGLRGTDSLEIFQCPEPDQAGYFDISFFCHGLRHLPKETLSRVNTLATGEKLYVMQDIQNPFDTFALSLRTGDPATMVGYCPRYLIEDFGLYIKENPNAVEFQVYKVNVDAPAQLRLMCKMRAPWVDKYQPCSGDQYRPLVDSLPSLREVAG